MSILTHKVGKVKIDANDLGEVNNAVLSIVIDISETTQLGNTWKQNMALGKSWTLGGTLKYNPANAAQLALKTEFIDGDGELADVRMYEDDTNYFTGAAIITAFNITKAINAADVLAITIVGDGALTLGP